MSMKQREVIFLTEYKGHRIEVVRVSTVLDAVGRKMKVERRLQAFVNGMPLKYEETERSDLKRDLVELAQAIADQLPSPQATPGRESDPPAGPQNESAE